MFICTKLFTFYLLCFYFAADSPAIDPSTTNEINEATIAVIDTNILAHNYQNMPKLKWAHCTWAGELLHSQIWLIL